MTEFSERTRRIRYLFGTEDGQPPALDLRGRPELTEIFDTNEWLARLVAQQASTLGVEIPPGPIDTTEFVVLGAMAMAFKTHSAIPLLCRQGYREDAFARLRTLFELALDLPYMRMDPEQTSELAERWLDWATVVQHRLLGVLERGDDYFDDVRKALDEHPEEMAALNEAIERVKAKGTHWFIDSSGRRRTRSHWSGKDTADVAREVGWQIE